MHADETLDPVDLQSMLSLRDRTSRGLEEIRDALSRETHRGAIVLCTLVGALWLLFAGGVSAATREPPLAANILAFERRPEPEIPRVAPGPIEWPTIAIAPRPDPFPKKAKVGLRKKKGR